MNGEFIQDPDVILIGSGIMSANLATLLKQLNPDISIELYEATEKLAQESSHGWNNAGTGHAGICELSYTPFRNPDGSVDIRKAIEIFDQFEHTKQFWSYAVRSGMVEHPREFIRPLPHISFVHGQEQVDFLKARHAGLSSHPFFQSMQYSTDRDQIAAWAPLLLEGRAHIPIAATWMNKGSDVDFGTISRKLLTWLNLQKNCRVSTSHRVIDIRDLGNKWQVTVKNMRTGDVFHNRASFLFVGAGGGSLPLLQKSGIPQSKGLGGFPIGGQWLVCKNPEIVARHQAKVYGQALKEAPTMAVPHLDTRVLDGKKHLLFGPFAAWTTRFLHGQGSWTDLPGSIRFSNLATLFKVGIHNLDLVRYLVRQGTQSMESRIQTLRIFYPDAQLRDWELIDAGIRVQAIKKTDGQAGIVHYGTEVITSSNRTLAALLGASPGASVCVHIALQVIQQCFPQLLQQSSSKDLLREMVPSWVEDFRSPQNASRFEEVYHRTNQTLGL
jgi:malate dehydrogenase (quinone)